MVPTLARPAGLELAASATAFGHRRKPQVQAVANDTGPV
jgi:hypothetical protein